jgi:hypothetical protein
LRGSVILNKNFKKIISSILILVFTLSSLCVVSFADESTLYIDMPENEELITKNPGKGWIRYGNGPQEVYDAKLAEKALYYSKTGYMRFRWDIIEPEEGQFNWKPIDDALAAWDSVGMGYGFGVMCLDTTQREGQYTTPKWVFDAGAEYYYGDMPALQGDSTAGAANSSKMYLPIQDDPIYMEKVENFVKALAERYDNDPRVEFIDIRSYGNYGEFHIIDCPKDFPPISNEAMRWHIDVHAKYFKNTQVIIPSGFAYTVNKSVVEPEYIYNQGIGFRHDGGYAKTATGPYFHGHQPSINEQGPPYENFKASKGFHHDLYLDYVGNMKFSYMDIGEWGRNTETFIKEQEPIIRFLTNKIGYHFVMKGAELPKSVSAGQNFNVTFDWINKGITYLYKDAVIDVALLDSNDKVVKTYRSSTVPTRNWAPEELVKDTVGINLDNVANGNYKLAIGIGRNEAKFPDDGKPDFQIGNFGMTADKWYVFADAVKSGNTFTFSKHIEENLVNGVSFCSEPVVANGMNYVKVEEVVKALSSNYEVVEGGNIVATIDTQVITIDPTNCILYVDGVASGVANAVVRIAGVPYVAVPALDAVASIEINDTPAVREIMTNFYKGSIIERLGKVSNPGFEIDDNAWSFDSNYFNITSDDKFEGNQSLHFAGNAQSSCYQQFDIEENQLYNLSFKIKSDGPLKFRLTSSTGEVMATKTTEGTGGEWKEYNMNFDYYDIGTEYVQKLWKPATVTLTFDSLSDSKEGYIDDVKITKIGDPIVLHDPESYVIDYGFESVKYNWTQYLQSNMVRCSDNPHSGTYCLQWDAVNNGYGINYNHTAYENSLVYDGGAGKYHFEGWFRTAPGEKAERFGLDPFRIYTYNKQGIVGVTEGAPRWSRWTLTEEWQKIEFDFEITQEMLDKVNNNVPGLITTNYAMLHITLGSQNRINSQGTRNQIFMDDVKITKVD